MSDEQGHAGYYKAMVQNDISSELTVTARTGMARYRNVEIDSGEEDDIYAEDDIDVEENAEPNEEPVTTTEE